MEPYTVVASDNAASDLQLITEREIVKAQALLQISPLNISKIIAMRLADHVNLNLRQKGFVRGVDGCNTNIRVLQACIQEARWRGTELAIAFLDLAKAFDSVSHNSILRPLKRHAVPIYLQRLIENMLTGGSTVVELSSRRSAPLPIRCGVKLGDPIYPCYSTWSSTSSLNDWIKMLTSGIVGRAPWASQRKTGKEAEASRR
ncbi:hypothetical protein D918_10024 [Trichuris suis]|nr:hypothetical protein D918_10024 [Trichuris suis]